MHNYSRDFFHSFFLSSKKILFLFFASFFSGITNSNGIAEVIVSNISSDTTFTATYSNVSDSCTVTVSTILFYDDCTSDSLMLGIVK